jgi:hypothetical protein
MRELEIQAIEQPRAAALAVAMSNMTGLISFKVGAGWHKRWGPTPEPVPAEFLMRALQHCPKLMKLSINQLLSGISEQSMCGVFEACPALRYVSFHSSIRFTDTIVLSMAAHCANLTDVSFTAAAALSDVAITALARQGCSLKSVTIADAPALTDVTLQAFAQHCSLLFQCLLRDSPRMTAVGIRHLLLHCPKLAYASFPPSCMGDSEKDIKAQLSSRLYMK